MCPARVGCCGGPGAGGGIAPGGRDRDIHSLAGHTEKSRSSFLLLMHKNMMRNCRLQSSLHGLCVTEGPEAPGQVTGQKVGGEGSLDSRSFVMLARLLYLHCWFLVK